MYYKLKHAIIGDIKIQYKYKFYHVGIFMMILWVLILYNLPKELLKQYYAPFLLLNLNIGTFFFVGGLILFEKSERTLDAILVSPLGFRRYVISKLVSLIILALVENTFITIFLFGFVNVNWFNYLLSVIVISVIYILFGIGLVVKYNGISDFLFPAILFNFVLEFPSLYYFGLDYLPIIRYITPTGPGLLLADSIIGDFNVINSIFGISISLIWIIVAFKYADRRFTRYIIRGEIS
ncbi:MAG: ABC transporter permease [Candidatus Heimdallarchaeota archaeon]|nr:ABC transporter permease [Candidatus Heimdallarchaeota archaeon]MDH5645724.1 ABC transporter permease [Candidatus Heimdallarchaeota archaeon]